jgi:hypothetical protein
VSPKGVPELRGDPLGIVVGPAIDAFEANRRLVVHISAREARLDGARLVVIEADVPEHVSAFWTFVSAAGTELRLGLGVAALEVMHHHRFLNVGGSARMAFLAHRQVSGTAIRAEMDAVEKPSAEVALVEQSQSRFRDCEKPTGQRVADQVSRGSVIDGLEISTSRIQSGEEDLSRV